MFRLDERAFFVYPIGMKKLFVAALFSSLLLSCQLQQQQGDGTDKKNGEEKTFVAPPLHLGAVHQVYPDRHFALVRLIGPRPEEGATLISHPADGSTDRVGNLCVSSGQHTRSNMIAVDIRSGTVIKGDRVYVYQSISAPDAKEQTGDIDPNAESLADNPNFVPPTIHGDTDTLQQVPTLPETVQADVPDTPAVPIEPASVETTVVPDDGTGIPTPTAPSSKLSDIPDNYDDWVN